jgi:hypothetical protein
MGSFLFGTNWKVNGINSGHILSVQEELLFIYLPALGSCSVRFFSSSTVVETCY